MYNKIKLLPKDIQGEIYSRITDWRTVFNLLIVYNQSKHEYLEFILSNIKHIKTRYGINKRMLITNICYKNQILNNIESIGNTFLEIREEDINEKFPKATRLEILLDETDGLLYKEKNLDPIVSLLKKIKNPLEEVDIIGNVYVSIDFKIKHLLVLEERPVGKKFAKCL